MACACSEGQFAGEQLREEANILRFMRTKLDNDDGYVILMNRDELLGV